MFLNPQTSIFISGLYKKILTILNVITDFWTPHYVATEKKHI